MTDSPLDPAGEQASRLHSALVVEELITANNVVANINDLDAFMEGIVHLLAEDGTFVFESFYLGDVVKNMVFDFIYHEHLSAFSIRPVKRLMERFGLKLAEMRELAQRRERLALCGTLRATLIFFATETIMPLSWPRRVPE